MAAVSVKRSSCLRKGAQPRVLHARGSFAITFVPREIENNSYAKFWGVNKVH